MADALLPLDNWYFHGSNALLQAMQILKEYETVINSIHELEPIIGAFFCDKLYKSERATYDERFEELIHERPERERYPPWKYVEDALNTIEQRKDYLARLIKTIKKRDEEEKKKMKERDEEEKKKQMMKECEEELKKKKMKECEERKKKKKMKECEERKKKQVMKECEEEEKKKMKERDEEELKKKMNEDVMAMLANN